MQTCRCAHQFPSLRRGEGIQFAGRIRGTLPASPANQCTWFQSAALPRKLQYESHVRC